MITSINEWRKYNEAEQISMFSTSATLDDVNKFRNNIKNYFQNGFNMKTIKDSAILDKLVFSEYLGGVVIDYSAMNDGSACGLLYNNVYNKLYPGYNFKCMGWQNYTKASLKHFISFLFQKTYSFYNSIVIDDITLMSDDKMIVTMKSANKTNEKTYYNSHGHTMLFSEFIELEVDERENYEMSDVEEWMVKYKITTDSECIWVTEDKAVAKSYHYTDGEEVVEIDSEKGFIIPETDDGDEGFLFIYK